MLRAAARSRAALLASALWGFAEATRFYVVPDVLVGWIALHGVRRGVAASLWATAGAMLGGLAVHADSRAQRARLVEIPGISEAMVEDASTKLARDGWWALLRGPLDGIPYKVYAAEAGARGLPSGELVAWTIPARLWRLLAVALGAGLTGVAFRGSIRRREGAWLAAYLGFWAVTYARYFARLERTYGSRSDEQRRARERRIEETEGGPEDGPAANSEPTAKQPMPPRRAKGPQRGERTERGRTRRREPDGDEQA